MVHQTCDSSVVSREEVGMELILSGDVVHVADFDFLGNRHTSRHELSPTLKENGLGIMNLSWFFLTFKAKSVSDYQINLFKKNIYIKCGCLLMVKQHLESSITGCMKAFLSKWLTIFLESARDRSIYLLILSFCFSLCSTSFSSRSLHHDARGEGIGK